MTWLHHLVNFGPVTPEFTRRRSTSPSSIIFNNHLKQIIGMYCCGGGARRASAAATIFGPGDPFDRLARRWEPEPPGGAAGLVAS